MSLETWTSPQTSLNYRICETQDPSVVMRDVRFRRTVVVLD